MVKTKAKLFLGALVALSLMLGVVIQLTLAARDQRQRFQACELLARALPEDLQARLARAGIDPLAVRLRREGGCPACRGLPS